MQDSHYLHLLLTCSKNQAKALLETADKSQVLSIVKVLYNLEQNTAVLSNLSKSLLKKHKKLLSQLVKKSNTDKRNYSLIRKNWIKIHSIIISAKPTLIKVIV